MTTNSQLSTTEPKKNKNESKLGKQLEKELNHRVGDHMRVVNRGVGEGEGGKGTENK